MLAEEAVCFICICYNSFMQITVHLGFLIGDLGLKFFSFMIGQRNESVKIFIPSLYSLKQIKKVKYVVMYVIIKKLQIVLLFFIMK